MPAFYTQVHDSIASDQLQKCSSANEQQISDSIATDQDMADCTTVAILIPHDQIPYIMTSLYLSLCLSLSFAFFTFLNWQEKLFFC